MVISKVEGGGGLKKKCIHTVHTRCVYPFIYCGVHQNVSNSV